VNVLLVTTWDTACGIAEADLPRIERDIVVDPIMGCWLWVGPVQPRTGYGVYYSLDCRIFRAHRLIYQLLKGPITAPSLDHGDCPKLCVNPEHLDPVTVRENTLRGNGPSAINARKTHCHHGHPLSGDNLKTKQGPHGLMRICRICWRTYHRERERRLRRERAA
jgi:hypothetical protein